jgi:formylglycine-generating enzyme required for sulfatase activity
MLSIVKIKTQTTMRFLLAFLLFPAFLPAQERIRITHSCSFMGKEEIGDYFTLAPSTEADKIVQEICDAIGISKNFIIRSSDSVENALATMDKDGRRIILYNASFLKKFKSDARTKWAAYSVLAHEIGHHLNGHRFDEKDPTKKKKMELEADKYSGSALRMLNAGLEDSRAGIDLFALKGETNTHPPGSARREAVASGWKKQDEHLRNLGISDSPQPDAPDRDGDGVPNTTDKCPENYGLKALGGCPDKDNDGIPDHEDNCPDKAGLANMKGCPREETQKTDTKNGVGKITPASVPPLPSPDRDRDGVPDTSDKCPDSYGLKKLNGCPDKDDDGIPDHQDPCPDKAGPANLRGCPPEVNDRDDDGVPDHEDACPTEAGPATLRGCPETTPEGSGPDRIADNFVGVMIRVKGGTFQMGSNMGEGDEKPAHTVTLSDFYLGETEVTQAQWRIIVGGDPPEMYHKGCDQCPVEGVSWNDIQFFLKKLNARTTGRKYRLPTEAEWEYAARGGARSGRYSYAGSSVVGEIAWLLGNATASQPVKGKKPNELGFYDMSGNVWEWCSDWYGSYTLSTAPNPTGPAIGENRVLRGGSWSHETAACRVSSRTAELPTHRDNSMGFRLAFSY